MQSYGNRKQNHWAKCSLIVRATVLIAMAAFVFFLVYGIIFMPFINAYEKHAKSVEEARTLVRSKTCIDPEVKADLGDYGIKICAQAELLVSKDIMKAAVLDVLNSINFCKEGECIIMSFNIVTFTIIAVGVTLVGSVLCGLLFAAWILHSLYQMWQSDYEIPLVGSTQRVVKTVIRQATHDNCKEKTHAD